jgi:hypothetical protein
MKKLIVFVCFALVVAVAASAQGPRPIPPE